MYRIILSDLQSIGSVHRNRNSCLKKKKNYKIIWCEKSQASGGSSLTCRMRWRQQGFALFKKNQIHIYHRRRRRRQRVTWIANTKLMLVYSKSAYTPDHVMPLPRTLTPTLWQLSMGPTRQWRHFSHSSRCPALADMQIIIIIFFGLNDKNQRFFY